MEDLRIICLGVSSLDGVYLFSRQAHAGNKTIRIDKSTDGYRFDKFTETNIATTDGAQILQDFRLSEADAQKILTYRLIDHGAASVVVASSSDLEQWNTASHIEGVTASAIVVSNYQYNGKYVMYTGGSKLMVCFSSDLMKWTEPLQAKINDSSVGYVIVGSTKAIDEGLLVLYFVAEGEKQVARYSVKAVLLDKNNPSKAVWPEPKILMHAEGNKIPIGIAETNGKLFSYWQRWNGDLIAQYHTTTAGLLERMKVTNHPRLKRFVHNPVLKPITKHYWQSEAVFNPAAVQDEGKVHLLYRAVGDTNTSVWGHAKSKDGVNFERSDEPVYAPSSDFEGVYKKPISPGNYISGPGWGGCEDPRAVIIEDKLYVTYVAFDGYNPQRVAMTSMDIDDLRSGSWQWSAPITLSPPGKSNKNWVLFPEKIRGKFALVHSITPEISIEYIDNFEDLDHVESHFAQTNRYDHWDNWVRGVGPPPIKTPEGWLLFYHAMDVNDPGKYKLGAMLLDINDPTKILYRSASPVLEPVTDYENGGLKPGVIFATGAVKKDDDLYIYYGSSDHTVSMAYYHLDRFLYQLKHHQPIRPSRIERKEVGSGQGR